MPQQGKRTLAGSGHGLGPRQRSISQTLQPQRELLGRPFRLERRLSPRDWADTDWSRHRPSTSAKPIRRRQSPENPAHDRESSAGDPATLITAPPTNPGPAFADGMTRSVLRLNPTG